MGAKTLKVSSNISLCRHARPNSSAKKIGPVTSAESRQSDKSVDQIVDKQKEHVCEPSP